MKTTNPHCRGTARRPWWKRFWFISAALAFTCLLAFGAHRVLAQNATLDLSHLDKLAKKAKESHSINLGKPILWIAGEVFIAKARFSNENPERAMKARMLGEMLKHLDDVHVRNIEFSKPGEYSRSELNGILKQLQSGGWQLVVKNEQKKRAESTEIYSMVKGGQMVGFALINAEPKELTVINVAGPIDFTMLAGMNGNVGGLASIGKDSRFHKQEWSKTCKRLVRIGN